MRSLEFAKMVGAGNDFIVLDLRHQRAPGSVTRLARQLCRRARSVGADGLLTIEPSRRATVKMRVVNPDGSEAEMCGNGSRCVALYTAQGRGGRRVTIETRAGLITARTLTPRRVRVTLTPPSPVRAVRLTAKIQPLTVYAVNTGVPHAVLFVPDIRRADVAGLGPAIRRHRQFRPAGTNVDFVQALDRRTLRLRTYERGVEQETMACGTGAVAAALAAAARGLVRSPVTVYPTSGERLVIRFDRARRQVSLEGEVRQVYKGTLS